MKPLASRLSSASAATLTCLVVALQFAACSPDTPTAVSPENVKPSLQVVDLSGGPVIADIRSAWWTTKCLTIQNGAFANGTAAELQPCAGSTPQKFQLTPGGLIKIGSTYCLDATPGTGLPGDRVIIWNCHGRANQLWSFTSSNQIQGINGLCISFKGHPDNGTSLYIDRCRSNDASQQWTEGVISGAPAAGSLTVALTPASITIGQTTQATATVKDADGNTLNGQTVTWTSAAASIATVTVAGVATALGVGTTTITATVAGGISGSAVLTVSAGSAAPTPPPPPPSGGACSLLTGTSSKVASSLGKPGYLQSVIDPDFKTSIIRITGDPGTPIPNVGGTWPTVAYHNYSKDQAWTADQRLLVLKQMKGTGSALFLDGSTYQPVFTRSGPPGGGEWRLHPRLADIAVNLTSSGEVRHWNVRTNTSTVKVAAVSGYTSNELGPSEGNLSADGRYLVAKAVRSSDGHLVGRVIDIDGGTTGPVVDLTAAGVDDLDWVSVSAGGGYVVVYGTISGGTNRSKVWSRATGALVGNWSDYTYGHYDLGFDASGNEVAFGAVGQSPYSHHFVARRLDNGAIVNLTGAVTSYNWHAGTRSTARPGWGVAATNDNTGYALDGEIYGVKLDGSGQVERYAHHRSNNVDYDSAPFPAASPDGKRVIFASNWGSSSRPVQAYVVDVRPICP